MKSVALLALVLSSSGCFNGCNKKKAQEGLEPPPPIEATKGSAADNGIEPAKPLTGEELGKRFDTCWANWAAADWDKFQTCWTTDATLEAPGVGDPAKVGAKAIVDASKELKTSFPDMTADNQLELVHGHELVAVTLLAGTHTGPLAGVTAMNQKVGFLLAQSVTFDDQGHIKRELQYFDAATLIGQLSPMKDHPVRPVQSKLALPSEIVIAKDDATEKANVEVVTKLVDAYNKHDSKAIAALLADDSTWSELQNPKDWTKAESLADAASGWKAFSDLKMTPSTIWGAGPYVVTATTFDGTNDGLLPGLQAPTKKKVSLPYLVIQKLDAGKIKSTWVYAQGFAALAQLGLMKAPGAGSATASAGSAK